MTECKGLVAVSVSRILNIKRSVDSLPVNENGRRKLDIRFAGDGRRTSRHVGSVMCVISLLAETETNASQEYTVNLYNARFVLNFKV